MFAQIAFLIDCLATGMAEVFHNDKNTAGLATLLRFLVESDTSVGRSTSHYTRRTLLRKILSQIVPQSSYLSTKVLLKVAPPSKNIKNPMSLVAQVLRFRPFGSSSRGEAVRFRPLG